VSNLDREFGGEQEGADGEFKRSRKSSAERFAEERAEYQLGRDRHDVIKIVLEAAGVLLLDAKPAEEAARQAKYVAKLVYPDPQKCTGCDACDPRERRSNEIIPPPEKP
jgi:ferredoxin